MRVLATSASSGTAAAAGVGSGGNATGTSMLTRNGPRGGDQGTGSTGQQQHGGARGSGWASMQNPLPGLSGTASFSMSPSASSSSAALPAARQTQIFGNASGGGGGGGSTGKGNLAALLNALPGPGGGNTSGQSSTFPVNGGYPQAPQQPHQSSALELDLDSDFPALGAPSHAQHATGGGGGGGGSGLHSTTSSAYGSYAGTAAGHSFNLGTGPARSDGLLSHTDDSLREDDFPALSGPQRGSAGERYMSTTEPSFGRVDYAAKLGGLSHLNGINGRYPTKSTPQATMAVPAPSLSKLNKPNSTRPNGAPASTAHGQSGGQLDPGRSDLGQPLSGSRPDTSVIGSGAASGTTGSKGRQEVTPVAPSEKWTLRGLLPMIRMENADQTLLSHGQDLTTLGLNLSQAEPLHLSFTSPFAESNATESSLLQPEFHIPSCYNVQQPPPATGKVQSMTDETLFYAFYAFPRDALQETASLELQSRGWRYHKDLQLWLTKEPGASSTPIIPTTTTNTTAAGAEKQATGERGNYLFFDPSAWSRVSREYTLMYEQLAAVGATAAAASAASATGSRTKGYSNVPTDGYGRQGAGDYENDPREMKVGKAQQQPGDGGGNGPGNPSDMTSLLQALNLGRPVSAASSSAGGTSVGAPPGSATGGVSANFARLGGASGNGQGSMGR